MRLLKQVFTLPVLTVYALTGLAWFFVMIAPFGALVVFEAFCLYVLSDDGHPDDEHQWLLYFPFQIFMVFRRVIPWCMSGWHREMPGWLMTLERELDLTFPSRLNVIWKNKEPWG